MADRTLQIYEPEDGPDDALGSEIPWTAEAGGSPYTPLWKRIVWWLSLAFMLFVGIGVLQMLALLVQAERIRSAFQEGLSLAQLPKATSAQSYAAIQQMPLILELKPPQRRRPKLQVRDPLGSSTGSTRLLQIGDVVKADISVPTATLLPGWLGPRLPFVGPDEVHVHWQVTVGVEE